MVDIQNCGARPGGEFDNTSAIQQALDSCAAAGGGTVRIGPGVWMSYTLYLHDNTTLHLEEGAVLLGGPDPLRYPEIGDNPWWIPARCSRLNRRTLIYAEHCRNVGITGRGTICGNAHAFTEVAMDAPQELHLVWRRKDDRKIPGRALLFVACSDVLLDEFKIENAAGWSLWMLDCERIQINKLRIDGEMRLPNMDGIHLSACRDAVISNCIIRSSDDALVLRSHQEQLFTPRPCERVTVSNCVLKSGSSAIRIGWSRDYAIRNCSFSHLIIEESFAGISIYLPEIAPVQFDPPRGPDCPTPPEKALSFSVENIVFSHLIMETQNGPFMIRLADDACCAGVRNIRLCDVDAVSGGYPFIRAAAKHGVREILFDHCKFSIDPGHRNLEHFAEFSRSMIFETVEDLHFENVTWRRCCPVKPESNQLSYTNNGGKNEK